MRLMKEEEKEKELYHSEYKEIREEEGIKKNIKKIFILYFISASLQREIRIITYK